MKKKETNWKGLASIIAKGIISKEKEESESKKTHKELKKWIEKAQNNLKKKLDNNYINLFIEDEKGHHLYKSEIATCGITKIEMPSLEDPRIYAMISSVNLRSRLIEQKDHFSNIELK